MGTANTAGLVAAIRRAGGYSQEALARELGVSFATVNAWENGRATPQRAHLAAIRRIAKSLDIRTDLMVLVIDDDPTACHVLERLVEQSVIPACVETTTDPSTGLILSGSLNPDLILIDVLMPGIDGFEVAERLASVRPGHTTMMMFVTAAEEPEIQTKAHALGHGILRKPISQENIDDLLASVVTGALPIWA